MGKIGLLGGTFSPIHYGHLELAKNAYEQCNLDEVWFIPSGISYMKKGQNIPSGEIRYEMVKEAIRDIPYFAVSDMEIKRQGNSYTYETLTQLHKEFPEDDFYFIIGDDTLFAMETWLKPEEIFRLSHIIVMVRDRAADELQKKMKQLQEKYDASLFFIKAPAVLLSSTDIRNAINNGKSIETMVPPAVADYITRNNLYLRED